MSTSYRHLRVSVLITLMLLSLTACLSISSDANPMQQYRLTAAALQSLSADPAAPMQISVNSSRLLDNQRLWVMRADRRVQPFADFRWAMPVPELFRQTLIETLESGGVALAVDAAAAELHIELRAMEIEIDTTQRAWVRVSALATWSVARQPAVNRLFEVREEAAIDSADSAAAAVDHASQQMLTALADWLQDQSRR